MLNNRNGLSEKDGTVWGPSRCSRKVLTIVEVEGLLCRGRRREVVSGRRPLHFTDHVANTPSPFHNHSMGTEESIQVNRFRFCQDHGDELCHTCLCDYRMTNNIRVKDMVAFEVEVSCHFCPDGSSYSIPSKKASETRSDLLIFFCLPPPSHITPLLFENIHRSKARCISTLHRLPSRVFPDKLVGS